MQQLSVGARGPEVGHLQRLLNLANFENGFPEPDLATDCSFGPRTKARLEGWQRANGITTNIGTADPRTWHDLGQLVEIDHNVTLFPQPTDESCWSAAATMLFGDRSVGPGSARLTSRHMIDASEANVRTFLTGAGLTYHPARAWTIQELVGMLRRGPLWAAGRWSGGRARGGHVVVISAVWADQAHSANATTFRIHDPWPPNHGAIYASELLRGSFVSLVRSGTSFNQGMIALASR